MEVGLTCGIVDCKAPSLVWVRGGWLRSRGGILAHRRACSGGPVVEVSRGNSNSLLNLGLIRETFFFLLFGFAIMGFGKTENAIYGRCATGLAIYGRYVVYLTSGLVLLGATLFLSASFIREASRDSLMQLQSPTGLCLVHPSRNINGVC